MIRISPEDKAAMQRILENYTRSKFDEVLKEAGPVLRKYYDCPPERLGKRLLNSLFTSWLNKPNEAFVHYWALCRLVTEYGYPKDQLDEEVSCGELGRRATAGSGGTLADIVIYSHESRRPGTALVAVECREPGGPDGVAQAASYSRALQARYHLFTDTERWDAFRTQPHPVDGVPISDIPRWVGYKPIRVRLSKAHSLPPLTDEQQLREFIKACHDSIHAEGIDPAKAFDELVKLFFVKVFDEQEVPDLYQFSVLGVCRRTLA